MVLGQIFQEYNSKRYTQFGTRPLLIGCFVHNVLYRIYSYKLVFLQLATRDGIPTHDIRIHTTVYVQLHELMTAFVLELLKNGVEFLPHPTWGCWSGYGC
jgi:hypothetical protein